MKRLSIPMAATIFAILILTSALNAQTGAGLPFLKIATGARQAGLGGAFTGVADDIYSLWWNPGGVGMIRRWQWSASYNRWFADVYQANLSYARQFRILGSRKTGVGVSLSYLGMPDWDATGGLRPAVSADHLSVGLTIGQRLDWIHRGLGIGGSVKGIVSNFNQLSTNAIASDVGLVFRPDRFKLGNPGTGLFDYGVITLGVSLLHIGSDIVMDQSASTLPRTWRGGASLHLGRHRGINMLFAADIAGVKDRDAILSFGVEAWYRSIIGVRGGYQSNGKDLGSWTIGAGLRWDDVLNSLLGLPTRFGDAFQFDFADAGYGDVLQTSYRGTVTHYPIAPEPFELGEPQVVTSKVAGVSSQVDLFWEKAFDPDPFDEIRYVVMIDKDKDRLNRAIHMVEHNLPAFRRSSLKDSLLLVDYVPTTSYRTDVADRGIYYWAVAAYDLDDHAQLAKRGRQSVGRFIVETADLLVENVIFNHTEWITTTPEQGVLSITIVNQGNGPSPRYRFIARIRPPASVTAALPPLFDMYMPALKVNEDTTLHIDWNSPFMGVHNLLSEIIPDTTMLELNGENNHRIDRLVSVPKGVLDVRDSVEVVATGYEFAEIPVVPEVYFDAFVDTVLQQYVHVEWPLPAILETVVDRMQKNPQISIALLGTIDKLTGESDTGLALKRAEAVKRKLEAMGVSGRRIEVVRDHDGILQGLRPMPADPMDALFHKQQNRKVMINVEQQYQHILFAPHKVAVDTTIRNPIPMGIAIHSPALTLDWQIFGGSDVFLTDVTFILGDSIVGTIKWDGTGTEGRLVPLNNYFTYQLTMKDTLGREFKTRPASIYILEKQTIRRREMFGAAKFAKTEPVYRFYWDRLMEIAEELVDNANMRLQFEGHACQTGAEALNDRLSKARAAAFTQAFLEELQKNHPEKYSEVRRRVDAPAGFGEYNPLSLRLKGKREVLLGDNQTPFGRYLNRRIMVLLYLQH
ncbi:PorV/PorQ family protein [bacterium]|nr:PorV/PorQ family protein [bacterium]